MLGSYEKNFKIQPFIIFRLKFRQPLLPLSERLFVAAAAVAETSTTRNLSSRDAREPIAVSVRR